MGGQNTRPASSDYRVNVQKSLADVSGDVWVAATIPPRSDVDMKGKAVWKDTNLDDEKELQAVNKNKFTCTFGFKMQGGIFQGVNNSQLHAVQGEPVAIDAETLSQKTLKGMGKTAFSNFPTGGSNNQNPVEQYHREKCEAGDTRKPPSCKNF